MQRTDIDYGIDMFLASHKESKRWQDVCSCIDETKVYSLDWDATHLKRIFLEKGWEYKGREFKACVKTNFDTYNCKVMLQGDKKGTELIDKINEQLESNFIDIPKVSESYARCFLDVVYSQKKDRLREGEYVEEVEIDWEELESKIKEDIVLLFNLKKEEKKERCFPISEEDEVRYRHEILLEEAKLAYIVDVANLDNYEIEREDNILCIKTTLKKYKKWDVYKIISKNEWDELGNAQGVISNRIKKGVFDVIQLYRKVTKAELYRRISSYEISSYFSHIEVDDLKITFYTKDITYITEVCSDIIVGDLMEIYYGYKFKKKIVRE